MTSNIVQLAIGCFCLSVVVAYAIWSYVRVMLLRESLFAIRDNLWDKANELDAFDDPRYQEIRGHLNAIIGVAHWISFPMIIASTIIRKPKKLVLPETENTTIKAACDSALSESGKLLFWYVIYWKPFSGLILLVALGTLYSAKQAIKQWVRSNIAENLSALDERATALG